MKEKIKQGNDEMTLGQGCSYSMDSSKTGLNNNSIIVGTSGSGKSLSIAIPQITENTSKSLIVTVAKRRLVDTLTPFLKERGFDVQVMDFADPSRGTVGYDPLEYTENMRDINFLGRSIVYADPRKGNSHADPYFDDTAVSLFNALAAYVKARYPEEGFGKVIDMVRTMSFRKKGDSFTTAYDSMFRSLADELDEREAAYLIYKKSNKDAVKTPDAVTCFVDEDYDEDEGDDTKLSKCDNTSDEELFDVIEKKFKEIFGDLDDMFDDSDDVLYDDDDDEDEDDEDEDGYDYDDEDSDALIYDPAEDSKYELLSFASGCWETFAALPIKTAGCVFSSLSTVMDTLFTTEISMITHMEKKVNMRDLVNKKTVLFVVTSPVNPSFNYFINLFYSHIIKDLFEYAENEPSGRLPIPVHMICDDFACGGRIANFPEYISVFREKGISVSLLIQSESQLASMYGENDATTIINNCDSYVYFGGMDLTTCRNISIRLNAPLEDVLYMPVGREIIFRRGSKPVVTERYRIYEDELYKEAQRLYDNSAQER